MATLMECLSPAIESLAIIIPSKPTPIILSHQQFFQQVLTFQKKLAAIGISPKEAVAIALPNSLEFAVAFLATSLQRAICAPLNLAYKRDEFEFYLEDLQAAIVLVPKGTLEGNGEIVRAVTKCRSAIAEIYWDGSEISLHLKEWGCLEGRKYTEIGKPKSEDVALILHTSGTTGRPKAVSTARRSSVRPY
jgi:oxalate---CoA ligase